VYCGPQICQKCVDGRVSAPDPAGGAHDATPNSLVGCGGDTPSQPSQIPPFGAFSPSILALLALSFCGPNVKSWLRPWCVVENKMAAEFDVEDVSGTAETEAADGEDKMETVSNVAKLICPSRHSFCFWRSSLQLTTS